MECDLVLQESHPEYRPPIPTEHYCYRAGTIEFRDVKTLWWTGQGTPPSYDPTGERDFGSIDSLVEADGSFAIEGDFGVIRLEASLPTVRLSPRDT